MRLNLNHPTRTDAGAALAQMAEQERNDAVLASQAYARYAKRRFWTPPLWVRLVIEVVATALVIWILWVLAFSFGGNS